mmetsp:Transcript_9741/g.29594  ORF Transcript_9741/g.29594 Transcript_9741/m.29594 type:complete len:105 (+) Transcript_9741:362-676(+)
MCCRLLRQSRRCDDRSADWCPEPGQNVIAGRITPGGRWAQAEMHMRDLFLHRTHRQPPTERDSGPTGPWTTFLFAVVFTRDTVKQQLAAHFKRRSTDGTLRSSH